ncbi:BRCA1-associated RING domain protein 1 [Polyodon spathula]|uniref:BRCA1-associated RING domain protein 1 n=1 Tax=Polyodon spathula TaxID=7913 RepID=UPI001B7EF4C1|nr:BRCA1-associated RING domain protein 1 [Polyodon spathula]
MDVQRTETVLRVDCGDETACGSVDRRSEPDPRIRFWPKTRVSLERFRRLLLCSKCESLLKEPVCLGGCEHIFCWSCAGVCLSAGCSVCQAPAWVKHIHINRQLDNIVQLCSKLEELVNHRDTADVTKDPNPVPSSPRRTANTKPKKNFKIWFSPRSRKVRCKVQKPKTSSEVDPQQQKENEEGAKVASAVPDTADLSVFNFPPSSSSQGSLSPPKKSAPKRKPAAKASKKKRLKDINQEWGFGRKRTGQRQNKEKQEKEEEVDEERQVNEPSSKKVVSFCRMEVLHSPSAEMEAGEPEEPKVDVPQVEIEKFSRTGPLHMGRILKNVAEDGPATEGNSDEETNQECPRPSSPGTKDPLGQRTQPSTCERSPKRSSSVSCNPSALQSQTTKQPRQVQDSSVDSTPKRPRKCSNQRRNPSESIVVQMTPPESSRASTPSRKGRRSSSSRDLGGALPTSPHTPLLKSQSSSLLGSPGVPIPHSSPGVTKKNHKGETLLHLACIKGDVSSVEQLLESGADPNLKDHAGWTPLHEACNHGHVKVVELLLQQGALLNTTGYQNESPLHDAVKNGHAGIVELLLRNGASQEVLNIFGLRPIDHAETDEMRALLLAAHKGPVPIPAPHRPCQSLGKAPVSQRRSVLLSSGLTGAQQSKVNKLATLLNVGKSDTFNNSVTHIIISGDHMPCSMKCLLGVLTGCWILKFQWVTACLEAGEQVPEQEYEVAEGPRRGRLNQEQMLPRLFDGCHFYFLGCFKKPPKEDLVQLVREGGGHILCRQPKPDSDVTQTINTVAYHAPPKSDQSFCTQYIVYEPGASARPERVRMGKVWSAPSSWLIHCSAAFQFLPVPEPSSLEG